MGVQPPRQIELPELGEYGDRPRMLEMRACERFGIDPFDGWSRLDSMQQSELIAFETLRGREDMALAARKI